MAQNRSSNSPRSLQRQLRVGELIRRTLADMLNRAEIHDPDLNRRSITIGEVRCSNDLKIATVHVMPLGGVDVEGAIEALARNKYELRRTLSKALTLKYAPDLRFRPDETFDRLDETRRLFADETVQRDINARDEDDGAEDGVVAEDGGIAVTAQSEPGLPDEDGVVEDGAVDGAPAKEPSQDSKAPAAKVGTDAP